MLYVSLLPKFDKWFYMVTLYDIIQLEIYG